ncbi:hypothetical protein AZI11_14065 (plasmid) [Levilactobacillus brevis]|nr:hypothetical protein AZI11_14065 [Levilactobacillus brevis]ARN96631.1 hypothetical protein AZI12_14255 [Levilactobacillus brevis]
MDMPLPKKSSKLYLFKVFDAMVNIKAEKIQRHDRAAIFIREYILLPFYFRFFSVNVFNGVLRTCLESLQEQYKKG